jgi:hypothetical protein
LKGKKVELKQHFFGRNEYALRLQKVFYPIWITFHIWDIITRPIPQLNLGFDDLEVYPQAGAGGGNVSCDGHTGRLYPDGETFAVIRSGDGTANSTADTYLRMQISTTTTENLYDAMYRANISFDTSDLTASANISQAIISLYGYLKKNDIGSADCHICQSTQANANTLVAADYNQYGDVSFGSKAYVDISLVGYNNITLNESGRNNISKTGISKFGIRLGSDINNSITWVSAVQSYLYFRSVDFDGGSNKPKLVVTYTLGGGAVTNIPTLLTMGVG